MMKRKRYSAEFKAKVALEAIREELTTVELAQNTTSDDDQRLERHGNREHGCGIRRRLARRAANFREGSEKLHAKIGQLVVERDFLSAASSLILGTGCKRR